MRLSILVGTLGAALALASCGGDTTPAPDDNGGGGKGGSGSGGKGGSGSGGKGSGGSGEGGISAEGGSGSGGSGPSTFKSVKPCTTEEAYVTGDTVEFMPTKITYTPKCLKVKVGDTVTFKGGLAGHPLSASMRG